MCLAGAVVISWSLTQDVAGSNTFTVMTNIFSYRIQWIQWKHLGNIQMLNFNFDFDVDGRCKPTLSALHFNRIISWVDQRLEIRPGHLWQVGNCNMMN